MKKQEWNEGLNCLDPALVEEYVLQKESLKKRSKKKKKWLPIASVAACFALTVGVVIALPMLAKTIPIGQYSSDDPSFAFTDDPSSRPSEISLPEVPVWEEAVYTADEIAAFFKGREMDGVGTNSYKTVYVPHERYLYVDPLPTEDYLGIYRYTQEGLPLDRDEIVAFANRIGPSMAEALGVPYPGYEIREGTMIEELDASYFSDGYYWSCSQYEDRMQFYLLRHQDDRQLSLNGEAVYVNTAQSDEEILDSLHSVKNTLFSILGVSFPDAKVYRRFDGDSVEMREWITIYFYDSEGAVNSIEDLNTLVADYLSLTFTNSFPESKEGNIPLESIRYLSGRTPAATRYVLMGSEKRISLEEAEALLYNGYVFGGHACPLCMAGQEKVDFEGYGFVEIEYVYDLADGLIPNVEIPFYAFYKKIGTAPNGNLIYAKTYVPAIPVSGYTEYFEKQKENHGKYTFPETEYEPYPG